MSLPSVPTRTFVPSADRHTERTWCVEVLHPGKIRFSFVNQVGDTYRIGGSMGVKLLFFQSDDNCCIGGIISMRVKYFFIRSDDNYCIGGSMGVK